MGWDDDDDDASYAAFVDEMWSRPGVDLSGFTLQRARPESLVDCQLHSIVVGANGYPYLNLVDTGERRSLAADHRRRWFRDGRPIDKSAFLAVLRGVDPDLALVEDPRPASFEEARSERFDRFPTKDKRTVIAYANGAGLTSYRVISRTLRQRDYFTARCHFRWGDRRQFLNEGLRSVWDVATGMEVPVEIFLKPPKK